jgi:hypothetical protein
MIIDNPLPGSLTLEYQDEEWIETIDYEHIPFRCWKCYEHDHLFRDLPLNATPKSNEGFNENPKDSFTQVQGRIRNPKKNSPQEQIEIHPQ